MNFNFEVSDKQLEQMEEKMKESLRYEITTEKIREFLGTSEWYSLREIMSFFKLYKRVEEIQEMKLKDLTEDQKLMLIAYWSMQGLGFR